MKLVRNNIILILALVTGLSSCLKKGDINLDPGNNGVSNVVEFANTGNNVASSSSKYPRFFIDLGTLSSGQSAVVKVNVSYSGAGVAPEDITVNLAVDQDALDVYNADDGTSYVIPPASVFSIPSSVVIKKGTHQTQVEISITVNNDYDFNESYAIPLKITSASTGTISNNFGKAIYSFGARNQYDGVYRVHGHFTHPTPAYTGLFNAPEVEFYTVGATTVEIYAQPFSNNGSLSYFGVYPRFTVNPDNSVTVTNLPAGGQAPSFSDPAYNNRYDPATKTFYISYSYNTAAPRIAYDTCVYIGPRQ